MNRERSTVTVSTIVGWTAARSLAGKEPNPHFWFTNFPFLGKLLSFLKENPCIVRLTSISFSDYIHTINLRTKYVLTLHNFYDLTDQQDAEIARRRAVLNGLRLRIDRMNDIFAMKF